MPEKKLAYKFCGRFLLNQANDIPCRASGWLTRNHIAAPYIFIRERYEVMQARAKNDDTDLRETLFASFCATN
jgi:hypothetical protein